MKFISTRKDKIKVNADFAIMNGLSNDGGLFVPENIAYIDNISDLKDFSYNELATFIISKYFNEFDIKECVNLAYNRNFKYEDITPLRKVGDNYFLELYHGPTCAFKDIALQFLPHLMSTVNKNKEIAILSATSGDTGKAALEGFKDVKNTRILVLYPHNMVSLIQERQMLTTLGNNTNVISINGNFDDCQRIVKNILENYHNNNIFLTSANSINIARLVPQIVYYFKAYLDLINNREIKDKQKLDFIVPTGNFGDILAGYIAKEMGLPIGKLVCASNINNVLTDFFNTGIYNSNRQLYNTSSPSIDILISSNLERYLYLKTKDSDLVKSLMEDLKNNKCFKISNELLKEINEDFSAYWSNEDEIKNVLKYYYENFNYLIDTHTAVGASVINKYQSDNKKIVLATASPFKFSKDVYYYLTDKKIEDNLRSMDLLNEYTNIEIPNSLKILKDLKVRFNKTYDKDQINEIIKELEAK